MKPAIARKFRTLLVICLCTSFAGVIYQLVGEHRITFDSILFGLPLGLGFGFLELFVFRKAEKLFSRWTFTGILVFKAFLYTAVIYVVTVSIAIVIGYFQNKQLDEIPMLLTSGSHLSLVIYTLVIYGLLVFFLQINHLLGQGVLWRFITGKYHRPREEERIFMFLDMKSSTTIAEKLGHEKFYALLNELFQEITQPALKTEAEIYQYVGDEVVLTWEVDQGLKNSNCIRIFFMFKENLKKNSEKYKNNFGVMPVFKAGLHYGKVISAQIGDLKREIVYNGDVLNTASRIQNECNRYRKEILVSGNLMKRLKGSDNFKWEKIDTVKLRGKESDVEIFSVEERSS